MKASNKIYSLFALILITISTSYAQQQQQLTQFTHNPYMVNASFAGVYDMIDINTSFRHQWVNMPGAPKTFYMSVAAPLGRKGRPTYNPSLRISKPTGQSAIQRPKISTGLLKHGVGGYVLYDQYGHFNRFAGMGSYTVHVPVVKGYNLALSVQGGLSNHSLDELHLLDINDPFYNSLMATGGNTNYLDISSGGLFYSENLFIGYMGSKVAHMALGLGAQDFDLRTHHFAMAGYNFDLKKQGILLTPSVLMKYMAPAPVMWDIHLKATFNNWIWGGVTYRHKDALAMMFGLYASNMIKVGYSYDLSISGLTNYNSGTHEIVLGMTLGNQN